ncbi:MAG: DUF5818 domain-containing protein [Acidimicrobiales bacterium]
MEASDLLGRTAEAGVVEQALGAEWRLQGGRPPVQAVDRPVRVVGALAAHGPSRLAAEGDLQERLQMLGFHVTLPDRSGGTPRHLRTTATGSPRLSAPRAVRWTA